jgi:RNA ligase
MGETVVEVKRASIDVAAFREREAQGFITCRSHPTSELLIWNYTVKCQYERAWDEVTMQARGLITLPNGEIIAKPFKKFLNLDEHQGDLPLEPFEVYEKYDGSLGIVFFYDGTWQIATRGSFESEQAKEGKKILDTLDTSVLDKEYTYLFEIIY